MPLLKLWNTLRGRSGEPSQPEKSAQPNASSDPAPGATNPTPIAKKKTATATDRAPAATTAKAASVTKVVPAETPAPPAKKARLSLFGGSSANGPLLKQIKSLSVETALEVGVGDGSRAIEVIQTLTAQSDKTVRYIALDQFEMAGGETTLMQFHQKLRAAGVSSQVYPESLDRGLTRVAHTIGSVDLVLFSQPQNEWDTPEIHGLLARICKPSTVVLVHEGPSWQPLKRSSQSQVGPNRRAA
ncbi:hypothetical protein Pla22_10880 [Rubripirellula amarantea]|uniref:Uncharacterized protein n=1 Tax=Rubripirellula amarantea TaxID=2527999 RepID=A0A5C5WTF5_9BACT|nr:hypothetical protein [Rubripirellula amarantea]TWT53459.1 hypothetical protein Pla22_10880 [Rubripirellula amarantea]